MEFFSGLKACMCAFMYVCAYVSAQTHKEQVCVCGTWGAYDDVKILSIQCSLVRFNVSSACVTYVRYVRTSKQKLIVRT
jgi:hypothetical protein